MLDATCMYPIFTTGNIDVHHLAIFLIYLGEHFTQSASPISVKKFVNLVYNSSWKHFFILYAGKFASLLHLLQRNIYRKVENAIYLKCQESGLKTAGSLPSSNKPELAIPYFTRVYHTRNLGKTSNHRIGSSNAI